MKSQTTHLPLAKGKWVTPSGRRKSFLVIPLGSSEEGMSADPNALLIVALMALCLGCLPSEILQASGWCARESTADPQVQM